MAALTVNLVLATLVAVCYGRFDPLQHSGPASPYFDAPSQFGIDSSTPSQCVVDSAAYIVRHGSRYPEPGSFAGWQALFAKLQNATYTAHGPLAFLPSWVVPVDDAPHQPLYLTSTGAGEAFKLGVDLRKRYRFTPGGDNFTVWAAGQQRVVDTSAYFLQGYLSQGNYLAAPPENRGIVVAMPDSVNYTFADSLTPSNGCPAYKGGDTSAKATTFRATYQGKIAARLNRYLDGLALNASDVGTMQDLCGFQAEVSGDTRFCDIFEEEEWNDYEYAHDLNYYYGSGPGNPYSATVGFPWLQAVTGLLASAPNASAGGNATFVPPALVMSFTHDNNLPPVVAALGIWNTSDARGVYPLSPSRADARRTFRSSYLVSFLGHVALERLSCDAHAPSSAVRHTAGQVVAAAGTSAGAQKYVRIRINDAVVPVPGCASGPGSSCPMEGFVKHVQARGAVAGDFVERCGLQGVANATGTLDIFTKVPSADAETFTLLAPQANALVPVGL
ncbi:Acid phosphatase PHO1 [Trametes pubescens]|uniref:Acid phosphatase PHO1 n=1 Tax=Trametes pubescens TaxID=154538 RepID=A0A1M2W0R2_TRAPU|nr:Acid phosphatase PHO1 [Trametes pubescens]